MVKRIMDLVKVPISLWQRKYIDICVLIKLIEGLEDKEAIMKKLYYFKDLIKKKANNDLFHSN